MRMWRNGRRARFRSLWEKSHAGSSPVIRTNSFEKYLKFALSEWTGQYERVTLACKKQVGKQTLAIPSQENFAPYKSCHPHQKILISLDIGDKGCFFSVSNLFKYVNLFYQKKNFDIIILYKKQNLICYVVFNIAFFYFIN